ncbi:MAG: pentapeptide repeat-containing protein [Candidatus Marinimicrobia bacterium]|nr:pentapeptide repeat-containing protein [Candidatus Neomarinimicrobiota bacterium]
MKTNVPERPDHPLYQLLHLEEIKEFNKRRSAGEPFDLRGINLRSMDLRGLNTQGLAFTDTYLRSTDIRGLDLSHCHMEGASIFEAKISGTLFPRELSADEIRLSVTMGTRLRYGT